MEWKPEQKKTAARLALCAGGAAVLLGAAEKLSALEPYRPWLEEHKLEVGAAAAAALFGLSLLLFPLESEEGEDCGEADPYEGYVPVD